MGEESSSASKLLCQTSWFFTQFKSLRTTTRGLGSNTDEGLYPGWPSRSPAGRSGRQAPPALRSALSPDARPGGRVRLRGRPWPCLVYGLWGAVRGGPGRKGWPVGAGQHSCAPERGRSHHPSSLEGRSFQRTQFSLHSSADAEHTGPAGCRQQVLLSL